MLRVLLFCLAVLLNGCIRTPLLETSAATREAPYGQELYGLSRDEILIRWGTPAGTAKLSDGTRLMQYKSAVNYVFADKGKGRKKCTLRLWLRDSKIFLVDYDGDRGECDNIIASGPRSDNIEYRR